ncbi:hypothetical protein BDM02DRAFT_3270142 [Thelephora ganbajun]|uniref:Uncharacterized protein n=1 Tax=Thelephora ganbajun TaxID=370292 RepID=A0ACB6ZDW1_THEGA|nr:hypothetical protein BDM02DRAFT_3270142 [Thelephora ganbajun]
MSTISRLPSLTGESSYGGKTATSSPFASGLTTPNDEEPRHTLFPPVIEDQTPKESGGFEFQQPFQKHARKGPLFRVVYRVREAAKSAFETPKRFKKRRSAVMRQDTTNQVESKETPGITSDILSHKVRKSTEAVHRMIVESPYAASPALVSMGSFDHLESTPTPRLHRRLTWACRQSLVPDLAGGEDTAQPAPWTIQRLLRPLILALCFPFWTFAVGGCIFLSPTNHLDAIAFSSGFVLPPPSDIARFGYWSENAVPHMCTFLAGLCFLIRWRLDLGFSVLVIVLCLFWRAWSNFELDKDIPLGGDDRQSIYLVSMMHTLGDGHRFRNSDGSFVDLPAGIKLSRGMLLRN